MKMPWYFTNGVVEIPMCGVCGQAIQSGHSNCTCDKNHPDPCDRPTYDELVMFVETLLEVE